MTEGETTSAEPSGSLPRPSGDNSLLIVDDDRAFATRLARAMEGRGFSVRVAETTEEGVAAIDSKAPAYAVIDMRLGDGSGLDVITHLKERRPDARAVILTGYGNFRAEHEKMHALLDEHKIPHVYRDGPQLKHHWAGGWVEQAVGLLLD